MALHRTQKAAPVSFSLEFSMIKLSDTSVRLYRKKDGRVSVKLRGYLLVNTNVGFSLSAYLKDISLSLKLASGEQLQFQEVSFSCDVECYEMETMVHGFWASSILEMEKIKDTVGELTLNYYLSFTGHPYENPESICYIVPVIKRSTVYEI